MIFALSSYVFCVSVLCFSEILCFTVSVSSNLVRSVDWAGRNTLGGSQPASVALPLEFYPTGGTMPLCHYALAVLLEFYPTGSTMPPCLNFILTQLVAKMLTHPKPAKSTIRIEHPQSGGFTSKSAQSWLNTQAGSVFGWCLTWNLPNQKCWVKLLILVLPLSTFQPFYSTMLLKQNPIIFDCKWRLCSVWECPGCPTVNSLFCL